MKNKDYVDQSTKKKKKNNKKDAVAPSRPFPVIRFSIIAALVAGFAYFLFMLEDPQVQVSQDDASQTAPSKPKQQALPPLPDDEEWQFIEELENKQVDVEVEELEDKGPFLMQCASFRNQEDAHSLKARIAFAGFESQVREAQGTSGLWYKVILGPFEKKREAEKTRHILKRNDINGCAILLWR